MSLRRSIKLDHGRKLHLRGLGDDARREPRDHESKGDGREEEPERHGAEHDDPAPARTARVEVRKSPASSRAHRRAATRLRAPRESIMPSPR